MTGPASSRLGDATRTLRLLRTHATRPLRTADGPQPDSDVVRAATQLLRGHQPWAARR